MCSRELQPSYVLGPKDRIPGQNLPPNTGPGSYLKILVADVCTPNEFWIHLQRTHEALQELMDKIQDFYKQNGYKMPAATVNAEQMCIAVYNGEFHRAQITTLPDLVHAQVYFVDYGTSSTVMRSELRYMHQYFAKLPVQAIKASLANIKPANGATKWHPEANQRFLQLVFENYEAKELMAQVVNVKGKDQPIEVTLVDTTDSELIINDVLTREGYAEYEICVSSAQPFLPKQNLKNESVSTLPPLRLPRSTVPQPSEPVVTSTSTTQGESHQMTLSSCQSCDAPPALDLPALLNPITPLQILNMQFQLAYLSTVMFTTMAQNFGVPMFIPTMPSENAGFEVGSTREQSSIKVPSDEAKVNASLHSCQPQSAPKSNVNAAYSTVNLRKSKVAAVNIPSTSKSNLENIIDRKNKISNVMSTHLSGQEHDGTSRKDNSVSELEEYFVSDEEESIIVIDNTSDLE